MARGSIRKLDGAWAFRIDLGPDPSTGKRRQVSKQGFTTKRDAEAALRELSQSVDKGTLAKRSMRTLGDYLDEWHVLQEDRLRATTWHSYAIAIDRIKRRLGQAKLQALEPLELERFYAYLLAEGGRFGKGVSPKTVRNTHTVLRKALSDAERLGLVGRNAAASARAPSDDRTEYQTWSSDELRTFLDVARDDRLYAAFELLMTTGMRRGEVLGLRWFDVDFDDSSLSVANTWTTTAKGHRVSGPPKTVKSRRQVYLDPATVDALRSHRARQNEERLAAGPAWDTDCKYVFTDELGGRFDPETFSKLFRRNAAQADLPEIRLHDLRHSYATLALKAGIHPKVVSEQLGHATVGITLDLYSHVTPSIAPRCGKGGRVAHPRPTDRRFGAGDMTNRRALDQCRRTVDDSRARPTVVDEPIDDSVFIVWPSIGRQLPPRPVIFDMLCFDATPAVRSDLMQPLAFDESAWLADQLVDRVGELVRTWEPTTDWHRRSLTRSGRALEWIVWRVATAADQNLAPLYEDEAESPWAIDLDTLSRYGGQPAVLAPVEE